MTIRTANVSFRAGHIVMQGRWLYDECGAVALGEGLKNYYIINEENHYANREEHMAKSIIHDLNPSAADFLRAEPGLRPGR